MIHALEDKDYHFQKRLMLFSFFKVQICLVWRPFYISYMVYVEQWKQHNKKYISKSNECHNDNQLKNKEMWNALILCKLPYLTRYKTIPYLYFILQYYEVRLSKSIGHRRCLLDSPILHIKPRRYILVHFWKKKRKISYMPLYHFVK